MTGKSSKTTAGGKIRYTSIRPGGWHRLLPEEGFGHLHVDPDFPVDQLGDRDVAGDAGELIRRLAVEPARGDEEVDHLLSGCPRGLREVEVGAHGDVVGGRLGPRPRQL